MIVSGQTQIYAATIITYVAACVAFSLRLVARRLTKLPLSRGDYLSLLAFIFVSSSTFIKLWEVHWGAGLHMADVPHPANVVVYHYSLNLWVDMWLYTFSLTLTKLTILSFYWGMFRRSSMRVWIQILAVCTGLWFILRFTLIFTLCQPIRKYWHSSIPGKCPITPKVSMFVPSIPHLILEICIVALPIVEVRKLHMPKYKKMAIVAMFMSGTLVVASALGTIVHTALLDVNSTDITWTSIGLNVWGAADCNLAHFSTSLPLLRPVFIEVGKRFTGIKNLTLHSRLRRTHTHSQSQTRIQPRSNKMNSLFGKAALNGDSDSTYELAGSAKSAEGAVVTVVETRNEFERTSDDEEYGKHNGILVKNELSVRVHEA